MVWEAFKIFLDRLPDQEEYKSWMSQCQEGTATAVEIGNHFSQSEEHLAFVETVSGSFKCLVTESAQNEIGRAHV